MGAGLIQLAAHGLADQVLSGNPQMTFWRSIHRRFTNFAMDTVEIPFIAGTTFGGREVLTIPRNSDLIGRMYLRLTLPAATAPPGATWAWVRRVGHEMLRYVELSMGTQTIEKLYGAWMHVAPPRRGGHHRHRPHTHQRQRWHTHAHVHHRQHRARPPIQQHAANPLHR